MSETFTAALFVLNKGYQPRNNILNTEKGNKGILVYYTSSLTQLYYLFY